MVDWTADRRHDMDESDPWYRNQRQQFADGLLSTRDIAARRVEFGPKFFEGLPVPGKYRGVVTRMERLEAYATSVPILITPDLTIADIEALQPLCERDDEWCPMRQILEHRSNYGAAYSAIPSGRSGELAHYILRARGEAAVLSLYGNFVREVG